MDLEPFAAEAHWSPFTTTLVVGCANSGKTTLVRRLMSGASMERVIVYGNPGTYLHDPPANLTLVDNWEALANSASESPQNTLLIIDEPTDFRVMLSKQQWLETWMLNTAMNNSGLIMVVRSPLLLGKFSELVRLYTTHVFIGKLLAKQEKTRVLQFLSTVDDDTNERTIQLLSVPNDTPFSHLHVNTSTLAHNDRFHEVTSADRV